jgi:hypothetical protein
MPTCSCQCGPEHGGIRVERYAAAVASGLAVLLEDSGEDPVEAGISFPVPVPFPVFDSAERKTSSDEYGPAIVSI